MESVYKLSKYSQKIDEACRTNQLNKVMEYNKHELAYINKLSKYFGNQKGGATVEQVVEAVKELVDVVVADKDVVMNEFLQAIDNVFEGRVIKVFDEPQQLIPADILQKVRELVSTKKDIYDEYIKYYDQVIALKTEMKQIYTTIYIANGDLGGEQKEVSEELILGQFNKFKAQAQEQAKLIRELQIRIEKIEKENMDKISIVERGAHDDFTKRLLREDELAKAREQVQTLQQELKSVREQAAAESKAKEKAQAEFAQAAELAQTQATELTLTKQTLASNLAHLEAQLLAARGDS